MLRFIRAGRNKNNYFDQKNEKKMLDYTVKNNRNHSYDGAAYVFVP